MTEYTQTPLVSPPMRRGWHEIIRFRPLTSSTHVALVVTRRGRIAGILPANSPRVLSDYLSWPYDFREVDTRERLLAIDQRLESCDSEYEFGVSLRLIYQVAQPDRVALDLEDVPLELAHAIIQCLRPIGRAFGVEQAKVFEEHLEQMLIHGDALTQRVQALGLVLRRADATVTLDERARVYAEDLRYSMRERPLHLQVTVESLEPDRSFEVHVGGVYRLTERRKNSTPTEATEAAIRLAIARTLRRVGITFAPSDYLAAAKAMAETLRKDSLLQSELAVAQVQLLRPTVQIHPDRSMVHVPQPSPLALPDARLDQPMPRPRQGLLRAGPAPALPEPAESAPPWAGLAAASGRALPAPSELPIATGEVATSSDTDAPPWAGLAAASGRALPPKQPPLISNNVVDVPHDRSSRAGVAPAADHAPPEVPPALSDVARDADDAAPWADLMAAMNPAPPPESPTAVDLNPRSDSAPAPAWRSFSSGARRAQLPAPGKTSGEADAAPQSADLSPTGQQPDFDQSSGDIDEVLAWSGFEALSGIDLPSNVQAPAPGESASDTGSAPWWDAVEDVDSVSFSTDDLPLDPPDSIGESPADGATELPTQALTPAPVELSAASEPEVRPDLWNISEYTVAREEPPVDISDEAIARFVALLQSHGPAWFKMWVLELKESPERLPEILSEVTADAALLNQAGDRCYQKALLLALADESPALPPTQPAEPPAATSAASTDGEGDMPDWLRLRAKWNGNEGET